MSHLPSFRRAPFDRLRGRVAEAPRFIQVVAGPRQVGKSTLVRQVIADLALPVHAVSADDPGLRDRAWLEAQWQVARTLAGGASAVLVLDEIQKIPSWSETVKRLWDEDAVAGRGLRVILLASSPLLVRDGLTESLAGRFEVTRLGHWSYAEMHAAFGWDLDRFLFFGGYPGAAPLVDDPDRWRDYLLDSLIETTISRDILLLTRVDKPALLRQLFRYGADYSGQIVSYQKLVGQLQDAGNTTTLAHYLELLRGSGLLAGLQKHAGSRLRQRASSPKLLMLDTGLMTSMARLDRGAARADADFWGRLVETAVGAHLMNTAGRDTEVTWWREGDREVDFVVSNRERLLAIEVASGRRKASLPGLDAFTRLTGARPLLVGAQGLPLETALSLTADQLLDV
ncbi:MAG: ATP-binding protein [Chloroflexota bacterium]